MTDIPSMADALASLCPGAQWSLAGDSYSGLTWIDPNQTQPTEAAINAEIARLAALPLPQFVLPQDLMAQFTAADAAAIQAAVTSNPQFWLLWSAMQAQKDPMLVTNARFLVGWSALVTVLGAPRMATIATALGITVA
jgi:hypothetical protein